MTEPKSVQAYIDQTPSWPDGTPTPSVPMTPMQWRTWILATAGKFFEGKVVFMTGVALPLIVEEFGLSAAGKGMVSAAMTNLGPNAQTYLLAGEVFPTHIRGKGAGFAAAFAKIGAVLTAFAFPVVLAEAGTDILLTALVFTSLLGALITWWFRIETAGVNLEEIGR